MLKNLFFNLSKFANDADKSMDPQDIGKDDIAPKPTEQKPADVAPKKSFTIVNIDSETDKSFIALNFIDPLTKKTTLSSQEFRDLNNIADSFIEENKTGTRYPIWGQINNKKSVDIYLPPYRDWESRWILFYGRETTMGLML